MGQVLDIMGRLPRQPEQVKRFSSGFVNLGLIQNMVQSVIWGWSSQNGNVVGEHLPLALEQRAMDVVKRHVSDVRGISISSLDDSWLVSFITGDKETEGFSYAFEVGKCWGLSK